MSNNLLSTEATDEFSRWLIKHQQNGLLASFLKTKIPTVHACATKVLESLLRIGDADFLELLINSGIDISPLRGVCGGRHLLRAADQGYAQIIQILLKNGADANIPPCERYPIPALQVATSQGYAHIVQVLLKAGANVNAVSAFSGLNTALSAAVCWENVELVRILLTAGANIDSCTVGHKSAIMHSALFCDTDELHQILIGASSKDYSSITHDRVLEAASTGAQALSKYLLAKKGKPGDLVHEAVLESAFKFACRDSNHNAVISLLDIGVDPNCLLPSNVGEPLRNAVSQSDFELIKIQLQAGADINMPGILSTAIRDNMRSPHDIKMFQFLLDKGAKLEIHGEAALRYAAYRGSFEAVELLEFSGVDVNAGAGDSNKLAVL